jgi:hypothetical protein
MPYLEWIFVRTCSNLLDSHQRKCDCAWLAWQHGGSLVIERWWNHYAWVHGIILYRVSNYHDSCAPSQDWSEILPRLDCISLSLVWLVGQAWDKSLWFLVKVLRQPVGWVPMVFDKVVRQPLGSCGLHSNPRPRPIYWTNFWVGDLESTHLVNRLLMLKNLMCRVFYDVKL